MIWVETNLCLYYKANVVTLILESRGSGVFLNAKLSWD